MSNGGMNGNLDEEAKGVETYDAALRRTKIENDNAHLEPR
jgi:hypothetical protein